MRAVVGMVCAAVAELARPCPEASPPALGRPRAPCSRRPPSALLAMSSVDSEAVFAKRLSQLGLGDQLEPLKANMWNTYGNFAFAVPVAAAGNCDPQVFHDKVVVPVFSLAAGAEAPPAANILMRLFMESHALWLQDLKARGERTDQDPPRRLPQVEREARRAELAKRLAPAIVLEGDFEPAHGVVDRFVNMVEDDKIEHVPWGSVATRKAEVKFGPARRRASTDEKARKDDLLPADASTHYEINLALTRRSVAVDMAGLMTFETHELLKTRFMRALTESPGDPAYTSPSASRVAAADAWVWEQLSQKCARGVKALTGADPAPADAAIKDILQDYEFALRLAPLPAPAPRGPTRAADKTANLAGGKPVKRPRGAEPRGPHRPIGAGACGRTRGGRPPRGFRQQERPRQPQGQGPRQREGPRQRARQGQQQEGRGQEARQA